MNMEKKKIILVGGGFAGIEFVKALKNDDRYEILFIDKQNHHMFQPLFYQVACSLLDVNSIVFPFRKVFQDTNNVQFRMASLLSVDDKNKTITTTIGDFKYDYLVLAYGCTTNFFGNKEIEANALTLKSSGEAIEVHDHIIHNFEAVLNETDPHEIEKYLNIVIVGAGPTGVELAGSLAEMRNKILPKDYTYFDFSKLQIHIIEGTGNILNPMSKNAHKKSREYLEKLGIKLWMNRLVNNYDGKIAVLDNGDEIPTYNLIWSAGVIANAIEGLDKAEYVRGRRLTVDRFNKVKGYDDVFAIGDISYMETPKYPKGHPQVANVAKNQGKLLGKNIKKGLLEKDWKEYEYRDLGSLATVGKNKAVVDFPNMKFSGFFAWMIWMSVHLMLIITVKNRLIIFINWAISYFSSDSSLRSVIQVRKPNPCNSHTKNDDTKSPIEPKSSKTDFSKSDPSEDKNPKDALIGA